MLLKALGALLIRNILKAQQEIVQDAAKEIALDDLRERARRYFLAHVTKTYADEYKYNSEAYVKSLQLMELEIDIPEQEVKNLTYKFQSTLNNFERIFEQDLARSGSTQYILDKLAPPQRGIYGGGQGKKQVNPTMAYINKNIAKPARRQPLVLQQEQIDLIEKQALEIWEELLETEMGS